MMEMWGPLAMMHQIVPEILISGHPNKSEKMWSDLSKRKRKDWKVKDHDLFAKPDLWVSVLNSECGLHEYTYMSSVLQVQYAPHLTSLNSEVRDFPSL